jgi:hypothetical protein
VLPDLLDAIGCAMNLFALSLLFGDEKEKEQEEDRVPFSPLREEKMIDFMT